MTDFVVIGTDTDAGKTTFALLWLAAFSDRYEYWKPLETGASDAQKAEKLVPSGHIHPPLIRLNRPVAPLLGAREESKTIPAAAQIAAARPVPSSQGRFLIVETFGGPFSPLNESELQFEFIRLLKIPSLLVSSSAVGAIGRTLQCLLSLGRYLITPHAVVLVGKHDAFALEQITRHWPASRVFSLEAPVTWDVKGVARAAGNQRQILEDIMLVLGGGQSPPLAPPYQGGEKKIGGSVSLSPPPPASLNPSPPWQAPPDSSPPWQAPHDFSPSWQGGEGGVEALLERDRRLVWHPYTSLRETDPPLVSVGACDEFIELADGRRVIDAISSWWTILHGHRHPVLMAALDEAARAFDHVHFAGVTHAYAVNLAELLLNTAPWQNGRVFYSDNGSTGVEVALKMAYQYWCHRGEPERTIFVSFENAYHGDTFGAMAVGRDPLFFGTYEPLLFQVERVPVSPDRLDETLSRHGKKVAAVILEPLVQGAGGMCMHSPWVLHELFEIAKKHGVIFIADEVMTGGGRTGTLWAHQAAQIAPDLICTAKTLAGGVLSLAATLAAPAIVEAWDTDDRRRTFFHGHSFTAHPLACAVAVANLKMLTSAPLTAPGRIESFWKDSLAGLKDHKRVRDLRIRGTIAAIEIDTPGGYLAEVSRAIRLLCLNEGVLIRPLGSVLYAMPPMCTSDKSLLQIADVMKKAIDSLS